jgi:RNA-directed DNA polymerase
MHQKSVEQMELSLEGEGEALEGQRSGEAGRAIHGKERSGNDHSLYRTYHLMEQVVERRNAIMALKRVRRNKGSPGTDGMTVGELEPYLREHWEIIREQLLAGTYQPNVVRRVLIPKSTEGCGSLASRPCSIVSSSN